MSLTRFPDMQRRLQEEVDKVADREAHQCNISTDPDHPPQMDYSYGLTLKPLPFYIAVELRDNMSMLDKFCSL